MQGLGTLRLCRILAVGDDGVPVLEGTNARVLTAGRAQPGDTGRLAVCQDVSDTAEGMMIVVLGVLADAPQTVPQDQPLTLRHGLASLALHPDGRIRMTGVDIALDAQRGFSLQAGRIDLN